ncbi:LysR family transcriptional regulator [Algivirga pacifica]|uniref:LysR substrate-binding domain-containing protein n=1 Tax=Algivirga pacifica TaxID=1162670 RepID=A0ABP9DQ25_9BACT
MELRHLHYFITVAETLNFTKAAEKLHISQPPLSRQIKELEVHLNARLFDRNNKKVALTHAGKYFYKEIKRYLEQLERIKIQTEKIANNVSGEFRISYISSTFSSIIPELIAHLRMKFPYVHFKLFEAPTLKQVADLSSGKLDFGIIRSPLYSSEIKAEHWYRDDYAVVFNKNIYSISHVDHLQQLKEATFVYFNKDYSPQNYEALLKIGAYFGFVPHVVHEANNMHSILQLVKNGLGVSIVPAGVGRNHKDDPNLGFFEIKVPGLSTDVLLATPEVEKNEITQEAIRFLKQWTVGSEQ